MDRRHRLVAAGAALVLAASGACSRDGGGEGRATGRFGQLHTAVCRAAGQADAGDLAAAGRTFADAHVGLHDLAAAAEERDRAVAARLLEAKQAVEADLTAPTLHGLVGPVADAVEATGGSAPATCP